MLDRHHLSFATIALTAGLSIAIACSSSESSSSGGDGSGGDGSGSQAASDCVDRCTALAQRCQQPADACAQQCQSLTESQLTCLERAPCDIGDVRKCLKDGSDAGSGRSDASTGKDSGGACKQLGATGCNALNNPSGCCTDSSHPKVACNGNNDGKGNAQCCVNQGDPCTNVTDCCGYAGASDQVKALYTCSGTCKW